MQDRKARRSSPGAMTCRRRKIRATFADQSAADLVPTIIPRFDDGFASTAPTGTFRPNAIGIYDGSGNVAEWVNDFYTVPTPGLKTPLVDPLGPGRWPDVCHPRCVVAACGRDRIAAQLSRLWRRGPARRGLSNSQDARLKFRATITAHSRVLTVYTR